MAEPEGTAAAEELGALARDAGLQVAVAESLTSGAVASLLGRAPAASEWFAGGVVAYSTRVKVEVLGTTGGPVVNRSTAEQMARGAAGLTGADLAVATTGVGGPGSEEGEPAGTVWLGVWSARGARAERHRFDGDPAAVVAASAAAAVRLALAEARALAGLAPPAPGRVS